MHARISQMRKAGVFLALLCAAALLVAARNSKILGEVRFQPENGAAKTAGVWVDGKYIGYVNELKGSKIPFLAIKADILDKGVDERGRFRQHYANDELDASLLLIPIMGFLPPDDERVRNTVLAIADELTEDDLVLRYKVDSTDTGFEGKEGTFTICSFWLVTALAMIGELDRARALCKKLLSFASPMQLYAEEIDAATGEHLGNFPQAFTHLALIEAVSRLIEAEEEATP